MSVTSLDGIDMERLSADARETLSTIAPIMADNGNDAEDTAKRLGITRREVNERMTILREEMLAQERGAQLPPLRDDDYEALKDSIQRFGQLYPVLTYRGSVVDGDHRVRACLELGMEPRYEELAASELAVTDLRGAALAANTARRQLTPEQRRKIVVAELLHDPKASDRSIAAVAGVAHTTVSRTREQLRKRGLVERRTTTRGADGVEQPIRESEDPGLAAATQVTDDPASPTVTFEIAKDVLEMGWLSFDEWSEPFQLKLVKLEDGRTDLWVRKV